MNRTAWQRALVWTVTAVVVAAGLVYAFLPEPVLVDLGKAERGPLQVTIDGEGETRVKEIYTVSAPITGRMRRVDSKVGDRVEVGKTVLATIEPIDPTFLDVRSRRQAEAAVKAAEAELVLAKAESDRAKAELDFAIAELSRAKPLAARGNISTSALDRAEMEVRTRRATVDTAQAALEVRRFELETARAALIDPGVPVARTQGCCVDLLAPVNGQILRIIDESERVVEAGQALIEIGNAADIEVVVDLLSTDAVKIVEGAETKIEGWGAGAELAGRVRRIEPFGFTKISALGIEEQRVNVIIDFTGEPDTYTRLGHGFRVDTRILRWQSDDVLRVPVNALFREGDEWAVFVLRDGKATLQRLQIGQSNGDHAEVLDGLSVGEQVVLHPSDRVVPGVGLRERENERG